MQGLELSFQGTQKKVPLYLLTLPSTPQLHKSFWDFNSCLAPQSVSQSGQNLWDREWKYKSTHRGFLVHREWQWPRGPWFSLGSHGLKPRLQRHLRLPGCSRAPTSGLGTCSVPARAWRVLPFLPGAEHRAQPCWWRKQTPSWQPKNPGICRRPLGSPGKRMAGGAAWLCPHVLYSLDQGGIQE